MGARYSSKAQLKIQQMAFMLMAVFIFFVLAGLFYVVMNSQTMKRQAVLEEKENAIKIANVLAGTAEFSCGPYCVDADRAMALKNKSAYKNFWKVASIEIRIIGNNSKDIECTGFNYPNCNYIKVFSKGAGKNKAYSFVSVCRRVNENSYVEYKCEMGKFLVGYEAKW